MIIISQIRGRSRWGHSPLDEQNAMFSVSKRLLTGRQFTTNISTRGILRRLQPWERTEIRIRPWLRRTPLRELTTLPRPHRPDGLHSTPTGADVTGMPAGQPARYFHSPVRSGPKSYHQHLESGCRHRVMDQWLR